MVSVQSLSKTPQKIMLPSTDYSPADQARFKGGEADVLSITWNGTQTYAPNGRPSDSDHDN